jgi:hypothetical protein
MPADLDAEARIMLAHPVPVQHAMQMLRSLVRETVPEAEERAHTGWGIFNYYLHGELGYVGAQGDEAILGFTRGVDLEDPEGLLTTTKTARYMRQLRLPVGRALPAAAIRQLLLAAARLNIERGPRDHEWRPTGRRRK